MIANRYSSVWPVVLPTPLVSSWAYAGAVAAADGTDGAAVRTAKGVSAGTGAAAAAAAPTSAAGAQQEHAA